jgi:hypothetical protein
VESPDPARERPMFRHPIRRAHRLVQRFRVTRNFIK